MRWFERQQADGAQSVKFADVSPNRRRVPSWMPARSEHDRRAESSLKPPKLPSEFVDAMRHELDHEFSPRTRASLLPEAPGRRSERPAPLPSRPLPAQPAAARPEPLAVEPDPQVLQAFEQALLTFASERDRVFLETASQLAELAALIARRVIGRELTLDPSVVRGLVKEGIAALGQHDRVHVRLGPGFEVMRERIEDDLRSMEQRFEVRFESALEPYACLVETELGSVDESVESRLETLLLALKPGADS